MIEGLLCKDPQKRLGINGFDDFKSHEAFKPVDWDLLKNHRLKSPLIENGTAPTSNTTSLDIGAIAESETEEFKDAYDQVENDTIK